MGNCFSPSIPLDQTVKAVSRWLNEKRGYIHNLKKNLGELEKTMEALKAKRNDLSRRVTREENRGKERLEVVKVWLGRVEEIEIKVKDLLDAKNVELERLCLCGVCSKSLISSYPYGKNVLLTLRDVEKLESKDFVDVTGEPLPPAVVEQQPHPIIVGQETMLDKAWKHLMDDRVGMMGMYGMGGVGKTTLLTQINNKFSNDRCGFDFVIWIVVSKELHVENIQDDIAQKVGLGGGEWNQKNQSQKVGRLFDFLKKKRFVLLLDDIWDEVDLAKIGVPNPTPENRCKVAFTTRSTDVCARMRVKDPMEVKCLADNDAFDLFQKIVGQTTLEGDPGIPDLARIVAKKCSGLPLALNVIGKTMSCKTTIQEWDNAKKELNSYAAEFSDMEYILRLLKYSYDSLEGKGLKGKEQIQKCLLYCALFPEDHKICKEELIEYWICEGIIVIDGSDQGIKNAEDKGYVIIGSLVRASLLMEEVDSDGTSLVCMHDVVREMALWIASDLGKEKEAFIVRAGVGLREIPKVEKWNVVRRMSLMDNKIVHLTGSPECLQLTTLLLQYTRLGNISSEFFKSMPKLSVLDLSGNGGLSELPDGISKLVSLQYLNLSDTGIRQLPMGLQELKQLIHLDLSRTHHLMSIIGISSLHNLKVLKLINSGFRWDLNTVKELEILEHVEIRTSNFDHHSGAGQEQFLSSHRLMSRTRFLAISESLESSGISLPEDMDKLRQLIIFNCSISEIKMGRKCSFFSLVEVEIDGCKCLRELTFLIFAPNLRELYVGDADELEDIINKEKAYEGETSGIVPFQKLTDLTLDDLPQLKSIYRSPLPFPCLEKISVDRCRNLKKLPLDSKSCKQGENGFIISYRQIEWSEGMEWEDEAAKIRFSSCLQYNPKAY